MNYKGQITTAGFKDMVKNITVKTTEFYCNLESDKPDFETYQISGDIDMDKTNIEPSKVYEKFLESLEDSK
ncbi:hypothetical protein [uncultured Desulfosarcina sp.]|uniref:hypothetical protein n=1 Tax=uncultured Desulfosarcina sp. TaxID=218289 RepID=UPI0029C632BE|nr:hypothetical protein [uncultured Desulfosarcina sp.]